MHVLLSAAAAPEFGFPPSLFHVNKWHGYMQITASLCRMFDLPAYDARRKLNLELRCFTQYGMELDVLRPLCFLPAGSLNRSGTRLSFPHGGGLLLFSCIHPLLSSFFNRLL